MEAFVDYVMARSFVIVLAVMFAVMWWEERKRFRHLQNTYNTYVASQNYIVEDYRRVAAVARENNEACSSRCRAAEQQLKKLQAEHDSLLAVSGVVQLLRPVPIRVIHPEYPRKLELMHDLLTRAQQVAASLAPPGDDVDSRTRAIVLH